MSLDATIWAWSQQIRPTQKLVLLSLADRAGENDDCWPSIKRLEFDTGLNRKTVLKAIKDMAALGLLVSKKTAFGRTNNYRLIDVQHREERSQDGSERLRRNHNSPKNGTIDKDASNSPKNGTPIDPKTGLLKVPKTGHKPTKELYKESLKEKSIKKESLIDCFSEDQKPIVELIIEHRKEMGKPIKTQRAVEMLIKKFKHYAAEWGITFEEALDYWLGENWQSIDVEYKYPFRALDKSEKETAKKGTYAGLPDSTKLQMIARQAEKRGINPWTSDGNVKQSVIDDFNNHNQALRIAQ